MGRMERITMDGRRRIGRKLKRRKAMRQRGGGGCYKRRSWKMTRRDAIGAQKTRRNLVSQLD